MPRGRTKRKCSSFQTRPGRRKKVKKADQEQSQQKAVDKSKTTVIPLSKRKSPKASKSKNITQSAENLRSSLRRKKIQDGDCKISYESDLESELRSKDVKSRTKSQARSRATERENQSESYSDSSEYEWQLVRKSNSRSKDQKPEVKKGEDSITEQDVSKHKENFKCEFCKEVYTEVAAFKSHMALHLPFGNRPFRCDECGKTFAEKYILSKHEKTHAIQKPFKCHLCDKCFAAKKSLKSHISNHTGNKPYKCHICEKAFFYSAPLKEHMSIHSLEKRFKCDLCGKQFNWKQGFDHHMMVHNGIKPFRCDVCKKDFRTKYDLDSHMRYHTGERPFRCEICGKGFKRASVLKQHKLVHWKKKHEGFDVDKTVTIENTGNIIIKEEILDEVDDPNSADTSLGSCFVDLSAVYIENAEKTSKSLKSDMQSVNVKSENVENEIFPSQEEMSSSQSGEVTQVESRMLNEITPSREDTDMVTVKSDITTENCFENKNNNDEVADKTNNGLLIVKNEKEEQEEDIDSVLDAFDDEEDYVCSDENSDDGDISQLLSNLQNKKVTELSTSKNVLAGNSNNLTNSNNGDDISNKQPVSDIVEGQGQITMSRPSMSDADLPAMEEAKIEPMNYITSDKSENISKPRQKRGTKTESNSKVAKNIREIECPICRKMFIYPVHLKVHMITHSKEKPYKCTLCGMRFKHKCNARSHVKTHTGEKPFKCETCGEQFTLKASLLSHVQTIHLKIRPFKCDLCEKSYGRRTHLTDHKAYVHGLKPPSNVEYKVKRVECTTCGKEVRRKQLAEHMRAHSGVPMHKCEFCGKGFIWRRSYKRHIALHGTERPYHCDQCDKRYTEYNILKNHMKLAHSEKTVVCQECGKRFATVEALKLHDKVHNPDVVLPFPCTLCNKSFHFACGLKSHMTTHTGERNHPCSICGKRFTRNTVLKRHILTHTEHSGPRVKKFPCNYCDKMFDSNNHAREHMRTHTGERPFSCTVCGKTYCTRKAVRYHMAEHTGHKPFACNICGKSFAANGALQTHLQCHKEKQNTCEMCGNLFRSRDGLKRHMENAHTENRPRPFVCDQCGKDFTDRGGLKKHMLFHSDERNFECKLCGKRYYMNQHLVLHMRSHTGEKPYGCQYCEKLFQTRHGWKKHMLRIHQSKTLSKESPRMIGGKSAAEKNLGTQGRELETEKIEVVNEEFQRTEEIQTDNELETAVYILTY